MHDHAGPSLIQAAPFIARFRGQSVVVKLGGELFDTGAVTERIVPQLQVLYLGGLKPVLVHGGGKQIDARCAELGIAVAKRAGRRITTQAVLDVVLDVVAKDLNDDLCRRLRELGVPTVGFADGISRSVRCQKRPPRDVDGEVVDFGEVGDVDEIDVAGLFNGSTGPEDVVPVLPCVGALSDGRWVNVNGDSVASHLAIALEAQKLIMLSREPGVMRDLNDAGPIATLTPAQARELVSKGQVVAGMRAKVEEALRACAGGVPQIQIISGVEPQTLLLEIFTKEGCGTLISG